MHIAFKQEDIAPNQLDIDLKPLRLIEALAQKKLQLMHEYATQPEEMRANLFKQYFFGNIPLIEDHRQRMRSDLTAEQSYVVSLTKGRHLIEGPAGSGKTTMLIEHVKYLVYNEHVPAEQIMVITHYNSAISRVTKEFDDLRENGHTIFTTTINSFGDRIFKRHRLLLQRSDGKSYYAEEPKLLAGNWESNEKAEFDLIGKALNQIYQGKGSQEGWPANWEIPQLNGQFKRDSSNKKQWLDAILLLRQHGIFPSCSPTKEEILKALHQLKSSEDKAPFYYAVYITYLKLLSEQRQYTYDDQVLFALAILKEHPDIAKEYQRLYEHIVIDEFQDFTPAQAELLQILCRAQQNFMAFGDLDQAIRPKAATVLKQFRYQDSCGSRQAHFLCENFRSTQEILDLANAVRNLKSWNYSDKVAQSAVRGERGEKPVLLPIDAHAGSSSSMDNNLLQVMVQEALAQANQLPSSDTGSIALMVAKSEWFNICEKYLVQIDRSFSILNNRYLYQLHHINLVLIYLHIMIVR